MSFTRVKLQSRREHDRLIYNQQAPGKTIGLPRVFLTAATLLFAAFMYYVAMHYVPALASPRQIFRLATETETIPKGESEFDIAPASTFEKLMGPYYKLFALDRTYMRRGETIKIKFDIPRTSTVNLHILQCKRFWVVEIFKCTPINQFSSQKGPGRGIATFKLGDEGFYHFRHQVNGLNETDKYRLVWERVKPEVVNSEMVNPSLMRN